MRKSSEVAELPNVNAIEKVAGEAVHLAGSALLTAGVAAALVVVAIPASIGVGIAAALKSRKKRG
ncbi:hypothetical protein GCM10011494_12260 [Novosphingobium endophyticum]|uniref:Uncharacterized protein n=1 Tax=Novosphingobium endophyticum TaxID=1955250 RepID=A0A916X4U2_9SPHN|nr:hypothetical protein [Novosphingobium endophyticum]GGB95335.1 hypothetical protein GCM10011494_12260 [Novosphingobium endophyticum]